jgi:putative sterol carrier protein
MSSEVKQFFDALPDRVNGSHPHAADFDASYVFVIEGAGTWTVKVDGGKVSVSEGDTGGECTFKTSEKTFTRIIDGDQNPLTAYMTGKLKVSGDVGAAMKLKDLLG